MKVAFLDRDGTINRDYPDNEWSEIKEPEFLVGAINGMNKLQELGYEIIIVTNQYIINDGKISIEQYKNFTNKLLQHTRRNGIRVLDIFYCEHSDIENCDCKKPRIGMFEQAINKYDDINVSNSIMIGDSKCDRLFADKSKLKFYGIKFGSIENQHECYESISDIANTMKSKIRKNIV